MASWLGFSPGKSGAADLSEGFSELSASMAYTRDGQSGASRGRRIDDWTAPWRPVLPDVVVLLFDEQAEAQTSEQSVRSERG